jgi:hypothetical protein
MNEQPLTSEEITAFVLGELPEGRAREIESQARDDEDLATTIFVMRELVGGDSSQPSPRALRLGLLPSVGTAAVVLLGIAAYYFHSQAARAQESRSRLEVVNGQLRNQNELLKPDKAIVDAALPTDGQLHSVVFDPRDKPRASSQSGDVTVTVQSVTFPCYLTWTVGNQSREVVIPVGGAEVAMPAGSVQINVRARHEHAWFQACGLVRNETYLGSSLGPIVLTTNVGERFHLNLDQPFPPWNATMVRIRGVWAILTLEKPWANAGVDDLKAGKWRGTETLPNTALFWAQDESAGLARELASFFVANRESKGWYGKFRGSMHTSLIVPADADAVAPSLRTITADELVPALTEGFEYLRRQRPPQGPSIQEEIDEASRLLKAGLMPRAVP